ncbi:uncharacterized protein [Amphiura filiformis]|uniref:uncharacterized protein n=1 Tax=Amphiura filiformis TaxID=82378 RepID=UPI003B215CD0
MIKAQGSGDSSKCVTRTDQISCKVTKETKKTVQPQKASSQGNQQDTKHSKKQAASSHVSKTLVSASGEISGKTILNNDQAKHDQHRKVKGNHQDRELHVKRFSTPNPEIMDKNLNVTAQTSVVGEIAEKTPKNEDIPIHDQHRKSAKKDLQNNKECAKKYDTTKAKQKTKNQQNRNDNQELKGNTKKCTTPKHVNKTTQRKDNSSKRLSVGDGSTVQASKEAKQTAGQEKKSVKVNEGIKENTRNIKQSCSPNDDKTGTNFKHSQQTSASNENADKVTKEETISVDQQKKETKGYYQNSKDIAAKMSIPCPNDVENAVVTLNVTLQMPANKTTVKEGKTVHDRKRKSTTADQQNSKERAKKLKTTKEENKTVIQKKKITIQQYLKDRKSSTLSSKSEMKSCGTPHTTPQSSASNNVPSEPSEAKKAKHQQKNDVKENQEKSKDLIKKIDTAKWGEKTLHRQENGVEGNQHSKYHAKNIDVPKNKEKTMQQANGLKEKQKISKDGIKKMNTDEYEKAVHRQENDVEDNQHTKYHAKKIEVAKKKEKTKQQQTKGLKVNQEKSKGLIKKINADKGGEKAESQQEKGAEETQLSKYHGKKIDVAKNKEKTMQQAKGLKENQEKSKDLMKKIDTAKENGEIVHQQEKSVKENEQNSKDQAKNSSIDKQETGQQQKKSLKENLEKSKDVIKKIDTVNKDEKTVHRKKKGVKENRQNSKIQAKNSFVAKQGDETVQQQKKCLKEDQKSYKTDAKKIDNTKKKEKAMDLQKEDDHPQNLEKMPRKKNTVPYFKNVTETQGNVDSSKYDAQKKATTKTMHAHKSGSKNIQQNSKQRTKIVSPCSQDIKQTQGSTDSADCIFISDKKDHTKAKDTKKITFMQQGNSYVNLQITIAGGTNVSRDDDSLTKHSKSLTTQHVNTETNMSNDNRSLDIPSKSLPLNEESCQRCLPISCHKRHVKIVGTKLDEQPVMGESSATQELVICQFSSNSAASKLKRKLDMMGCNIASNKKQLKSTPTDNLKRDWRESDLKPESKSDKSELTQLVDKDGNKHYPKSPQPQGWKSDASNVILKQQRHMSGSARTHPDRDINRHNMKTQAHATIASPESKTKFSQIEFDEDLNKLEDKSKFVKALRTGEAKQCSFVNQQKTDSVGESPQSEDSREVCDTTMGEAECENKQPQRAPLRQQCVATQTEGVIATSKTCCLKSDSVQEPPQLKLGMDVEMESFKPNFCQEQENIHCKKSASVSKPNNKAHPGVGFDVSELVVDVNKNIVNVCSIQDEHEVDHNHKRHSTHKLGVDTTAGKTADQTITKSQLMLDPEQEFKPMLSRTSASQNQLKPSPVLDNCKTAEKRQIIQKHKMADNSEESKGHLTSTAVKKSKMSHSCVQELNTSKLETDARKCKMKLASSLQKTNTTRKSELKSSHNMTSLSVQESTSSRNKLISPAIKHHRKVEVNQPTMDSKCDSFRVNMERKVSDERDAKHEKRRKLQTIVKKELHEGRKIVAELNEKSIRKEENALERKCRMMEVHVEKSCANVKSDDALDFEKSSAVKTGNDHSVKRTLGALKEENESACCSGDRMDMAHLDIKLEDSITSMQTTTQTGEDGRINSSSEGNQSRLHTETSMWTTTQTGEDGRIDSSSERNQSRLHTEASKVKCDETSGMRRKDSPLEGNVLQPQTDHVWIIGDFIMEKAYLRAKQLNNGHLGLNSIDWHTSPDACLRQKFLKRKLKQTGSLRPSFIVVHLGANDLMCTDYKEFSQKVDCLIQTVKKYQPLCHIIWSSMPLHCLSNINFSIKQIDAARIQANKMLQEQLRFHKRTHMISYDHIFKRSCRALYETDGQCLSQRGVDSFLTVLGTAVGAFMRNPELKYFPDIE